MLSRFRRVVNSSCLSISSKRSFYMTKTEIPPLVTGEWLETQLERENVKVVDGSWHLPSAMRDAAKEFSQQRIPGATFFNIDEIKDKKTKLTRMMPSAQDFEVSMSQIGICNDDIIIVYDCAGIFSSPRVWYMLKSMGAKNVSILNGGFPVWKKQGRVVEEGPMTGGYVKEKKAFTSKQAYKESFVDYRKMNRFVTGIDEDILIVDARARERFDGVLSEGEGKKCGHIPGSMNLHYKHLLTDDGYSFKSVSEMKKVFSDQRIDYENKAIVSTCGSGVSAALINFSVYCMQWNDLNDENDDKLKPLRLYDGSWSEWGSRPESVVSNKTGNIA